MSLLQMAPTSDVRARTSADTLRSRVTHGEASGRAHRPAPWARRATALPRELWFGGKVRCRDGAAGEVAGVVVAAATWRATHLVLRPDLGPSDRLIPVELVRRADDRGIWLDLSSDDLHHLPPRGEMSGGVVLDRATRALGLHGALGRLRGLVLAPAAGTIDGIVVRIGRFRGSDVRAPRAWGRQIRPGRLLLAADAAKLDGLPRFQPAGALAAAVCQALRAYAPLRRLDLPHLEVRAAGGVVELTGYVRYRQGGQFAEELARGVAGVSAVRNRLVADEMLVGSVAVAVDRVTARWGVQPRVAVHAGAAILEGTAPNVAARAAVVTAARRAAGVRAVRDRLTVRPPGREAPCMAAMRRELEPLPNDRLLRRLVAPW